MDAPTGQTPSPLPSSSPSPTAVLPREASEGMLLIRSILNLSQTDLGLMLHNYSAIQISRFERGERTINLEVIHTLIPLLDKAEEQLKDDMSALQALRRLYQGMLGIGMLSESESE
jgi:hypothetical protein